MLYLKTETGEAKRVLAFLRNTLEHFHHTGALVPSSVWLARALAAPLRDRAEGPMDILEAGPGTGALTAEVLRYLKPDDHLTLCEINSEFIQHLEERFQKDPAFAPFADQVTLHHGAVEDLNQNNRFDHIVSGLPFNNFEPSMVRHILESFENAIRPNGTVSFFEYAAIRRVKAIFANEQERQRLREVEAVLHEFIDRHRTDRHLVLFNVPPAWACSMHDFGTPVVTGDAPVRSHARDRA